MIYQHNETFGVFKFYIQSKNGKYYADTQEELTETINRINEFEEEALNAKDIKECSLTVEQQARFDQISAIAGITLDDVVGYTFAARHGVSVAYKLFAQQQELIGQGQMITDLELAEIENGQTMTDLELALYAEKGGINGV